MNEVLTVETGPTDAETMAAVEPTLEEMIGALKDENVMLQTMIASEIQDHNNTRGLLSQAKLMLANPAFVDARIVGSPGAGHDGGVCSGNGGGFTSKADALADYNRISDPKLKAAFRKQHARILGIEEV